VQKGKGILAADESNPTCGKRFESIGVESTELTRNTYRDLLFTTNGMEEFISGVILFDETLGQSTISDGIAFPQYLKNLGVIPGIKVDKGAKELASHSSEKVTEGLDGLRVSSVVSTPMLSNRLPHVGLLSSAAKIPLPFCTIAFAVFLNCSLFINSLCYFIVVQFLSSLIETIPFVD